MAVHVPASMGCKTSRIARRGICSFWKNSSGPWEKNEEPVSGPGNAWSELMPRHSDVEMRIYILFKCRILLSTDCFLSLGYLQRFKLDGKTAIGNEAPERQRDIILSILTG